MNGSTWPFFHSLMDNSPSYLGIVYLKSWGMRNIGLDGLYVKLSAQVLGVSHTCM